MNIQHPRPEEMLVRFDRNPEVAETTAWSDELRSALNGKEESVKVDLTGLDVISSLGVNVIVGLYKHVTKNQGQIRVLVPDEKMLHVFKLFRLDDLFPIEVISS